MTEFETLMRRGLMPMYAIDDAGGGGVVDDDPEDQQEDPGDQQEEPITLTKTEFDAKIAEAVRTQGEQALERSRQEMAQRFEQQQRQQFAAQSPDPNVAYRARLEEIAYMTDPVDQEAARMALAEERVQARMAPALAHSSQQGTVAAVLSGATNLPKEAEQYVAQIIREQGIGPDSVNPQNPHYAANIATIERAAIGLAYQNKAFETQPAPPPRTQAPRPAPTGSIQTKGGMAAKLTPEQKAILDVEVKMLQSSSPSLQDKSYDEIAGMFTQRDLAEMFANVGMAAGGMR